MDALAEDLRRYLGPKPVSARADSLAYRTARFVRRHRAPVALAAVALMALAGGLVGTLSQARRALAQAARADEQARMAGVQRDFALRQLSRTEAINDLNTFLLHDAAPLGKPLTPGELLARAEEIVERQPEDENRVGTLVEIGQQYQVAGERTKALHALTQAHDLALKLPDPATRAQATCALASAIAQAGDGQRAEQMFQQAEGGLPREPQYVLQRVFCLMRGSEVAQERADARAGIERAQAAQQLLHESRVASPVLEQRVSMRLADSYRLGGRYREADVAFAEAFQRLSALGRDHTETAGGLLNTWALTARGLGQTLKAEGLFRRALQISSADGGDDNVPPWLLNNLAVTLRHLERLPEATDLAERAYRKATRTGDETTITQALSLRATLYRLQGDPGRAAQTVAQLEPRMKRLLPPDDLQFAQLEMEKALIALALGDTATAVSAADRSIARCEADRQQPQYLRRLLLRRFEVYLKVRRFEEAAADADRALRLELEASGEGVPSSNLGQAYLALGQALAAEAQHGLARKNLASAIEHLVPTFGADHPATREARRLAAAEAAGVQ